MAENGAQEGIGRIANQEHDNTASAKKVILVDAVGTTRGTTNPLSIIQTNTILDISMGNVSGISHVNKFGRAPSGVQTTKTDIWDRADATPTQSVWTAPTQARTHTIVSTSNNDSDSGGTNPQSDGARTIKIFGLTSWDADEVSEDIVMDGTNGVVTNNSYVIIHRMRVLTKGNNANGPNVGVITATATTDSTITAQINIGEGQTQMAIYGVPSTKTAYVVKFYATVNKSSASAATINFSLLANLDPDVEVTNFTTKNTRGLQSTGTSSDIWEFCPYFKIVGPAIIKVQGIASAGDIEASAGFDIILVDN